MRVASPEWTPGFSTCSEINKVHQHFTILSYRVHLDLLCILNLFSDDSRVLSGNIGCLSEVRGKVILGVDSVHGGTRKDIGGADQDRISNFVAELFGFSNAR